MAATVRPRRSVLYMPGSNARALEKARGLPADGLILDLEDAVAPDAKALARDQVVAAVKARSFGKREVAIRINGLETPWGLDDLAAAAAAGPDAILVPKVETAAMVHQVEGLMDQAGAPAGTRLWCMIETPLGVLHAEQVAGASPRIAVFVMGTNDIAKDTGAQHTPMRLPMVTALSLSLLAARAHGIAILDGVYNDLRNDAGFLETCRQGLEFGFDGKTLVHPRQIGPCNEVFLATPEQLGQAEKIVAAFAAAEAAGQGVVVVDGRMVENLHVEQAKRQLALAQAVADLAADAAD